MNAERKENMSKTRRSTCDFLFLLQFFFYLDSDLHDRSDVCTIDLPNHAYFAGLCLPNFGRMVWQRPHPCVRPRLCSVDRRAGRGRASACAGCRRRRQADALRRPGSAQPGSLRFLADRLGRSRFIFYSDYSVDYSAALLLRGGTAGWLLTPADGGPQPARRGQGAARDDPSASGRLLNLVLVVLLYYLKTTIDRRSTPREAAVYHDRGASIPFIVVLGGARVRTVHVLMA